MVAGCDSPRREPLNVFDGNPRIFDLIACRLAVARITERQHLRTLLPHSPATILACPPWGADVAFWAWATELLRTRWQRRLLFVAALEPDTARIVASLPPLRVLWLDEIEEGLMRAVAECAVQNARTLLCELHGLASGSTWELHRIVARLLDPMAPPVLKVSEVLGSSSPNEKQWHHCFPMIVPKDAIAWTLLLRAAMLEQGGSPSIMDTALRLGVHERRLDRAAHRLTGLTYAQLRRPENARFLLGKAEEALCPLVQARSTAIRDREPAKCH